MDFALELRGVSWPRRAEAVEGVDLAVRAGERRALSGNETTLFNRSAALPGRRIDPALRPRRDRALSHRRAAPGLARIDALPELSALENRPLAVRP
jgi:hypothetical protein